MGKLQQQWEQEVTEQRQVVAPRTNFCQAGEKYLLRTSGAEAKAVGKGVLWLPQWHPLPTVCQPTPLLHFLPQPSTSLVVFFKEAAAVGGVDNFSD